MAAWTKERHAKWKAQIVAYRPDPKFDVRARLYLDDVRDMLAHIAAGPAGGSPSQSRSFGRRCSWPTSG
jgi:hypothetical protein